jgi:hypothetical protein
MRFAATAEQERVTALRVLIDSLPETIGVNSGAIRAWFESESPHLNGRQPLALLRDGKWTLESEPFQRVAAAAVNTNFDLYAAQQGLPTPIESLRPRSDRDRLRLVRLEAGALTPHAASEATGSRAAERAVATVIPLTSNRAAVQAPHGLEPSTRSRQPVLGTNPIDPQLGEELSLDLDDAIGLTISFAPQRD